MEAAARHHRAGQGLEPGACDPRGARRARSAHRLRSDHRVGKEVTEAAVLRALGELWTHLRVLPLPQPDGRATIWELSGHALHQADQGRRQRGPADGAFRADLALPWPGHGATEDEIESFLSPLASRSRIRDVIHALLAARQLETVAIEGTTHAARRGRSAPRSCNEETQVSRQREEADEVSEIAAAKRIRLVDAERHEAGRRLRASRSMCRAQAAKDRHRRARRSSRASHSAKRANRSVEQRPFAPRSEKRSAPFRDGKERRPFGERRSFRPADGFGKRGQGAGQSPERLDGKPARERRPFVTGGQRFASSAQAIRTVSGAAPNRSEPVT